MTTIHESHTTSQPSTICPWSFRKKNDRTRGPAVFSPNWFNSCWRGTEIVIYTSESGSSCYRKAHWSLSLRSENMFSENARLTLSRTHEPYATAPLTCVKARFTRSAYGDDERQRSHMKRFRRKTNFPVLFPKQRTKAKSPPAMIYDDWVKRCI